MDKYDWLVKIFKIAMNVIWIAILSFTSVMLFQDNEPIWKIIVIIGLSGLISKLIMNHTTKTFVEQVSHIPRKK